MLTFWTYENTVFLKSRAFKKVDLFYTYKRLEILRI